ncbi:hypothetical protein MRX96_047810 [Rhipicephalus microplus]
MMAVSSPLALMHWVGTGNYTQSGQFGSRKGLTPLSSDADIQKLDPSGDCKGLASGDMTNRSRQLSNVHYSKQHFNTTDKQMTKALDNIDVPSQPKQSKGPWKTGSPSAPKHTLSPNRRAYSRNFLLQCSHSPLATKMPPDFPLLDPEVASVMLRKSCK